MNKTLDDAELLARLVAFDSTSSKSNLPIADFICDYIEHRRIQLVRNFSADGSKVNLVARLSPSATAEGASARAGSDMRAGLILSGHMAVVPADEPEWRSDPFELTETDDAYVARGACDMKGFVALAVNAMRDAAAQPSSAPLVLILTFDEELGTVGAQHLQETWDEPFPLPTSAIVGEPTSLRAVRMHKGHTKMRVAVRGKGAHSGYPHLGDNAIEPMGRILNALSTLRRAWECERAATSVHFPETPHVPLNLATIRGGSAINVVPERCVLDLGFRALPGMESALLIRKVRQTVEGVVPAASVQLLGDSPPLFTDERAEVYRALCGLLGQRETIGASYASDAGPLSLMGLECVVWGPGTIEVAHKPNESLPKVEFDRARGLLDQIVGVFCS